MQQQLVGMLLTAAILSTALLACNSEDSPSPSKESLDASLAKDAEILAKVNGSAITQEDVERHLRRKRMQAAGPEPKPEEALQDLIKVELIYQAARDEGYDSRPDVLAEAARRTKELIAEVYLLEIVSDADFSDETMRAEYEAEMERSSHQYKTLLMTRSSEDEAWTAIRALDDGADFVALAKENSEDPVSLQDGDMGWIMLQNLHGPLAAALQTMDVGDYSSEPVRGPHGWYVLLLEDKREVTPEVPDFEKVKEQIRLRLTSQLYQSTLDRLETDAKIEQLVEP